MRDGDDRVLEGGRRPHAHGDRKQPEPDHRSPIGYRPLPAVRERLSLSVKILEQTVECARGLLQGTNNPNITRARERLGTEPLALLFAQTAGPLTDPHTPGGVLARLPAELGG